MPQLSQSKLEGTNVESKVLSYLKAEDLEDHPQIISRQAGSNQERALPAASRQKEIYRATEQRNYNRQDTSSESSQGRDEHVVADTSRRENESSSEQAAASRGAENSRYLIALNRDASPKGHPGVKRYRNVVSKLDSDPQTRSINARNMKLKTDSKMGSVFFEDSINTQFMKALRQSKKKIFQKTEIEVFRSPGDRGRAFNPLRSEVFDRSTYGSSLRPPRLPAIPTRTSLSPVAIADVKTGQTSIMSSQILSRISEAQSRRSLQILNGSDDSIDDVRSQGRRKAGSR